MKFKCNLSGCVYNFESELDIKSMRQNSNYSEVAAAPVVLAPKAPVVPSTVVPVKPVAPAPDKPLPVATAATKAV